VHNKNRSWVDLRMSYSSVEDPGESHPFLPEHILVTTPELANATG